MSLHNKGITPIIILLLFLVFVLALSKCSSVRTVSAFSPERLRVERF